ncbi:hypothetical protein G9A89_014143 [Geosiphon pyriformis]|nr:hypothetical protein G9A89_014143 [Geosiphon pyriformis]
MSIIIDQSTVATRNAFILSELHTYDPTATLLSTSILSTNLSTDNTDNLSTTVITHLLAAALDNLSAPTNSNTTTKLTLKRNPKAEIDPTKLEINSGTRYAQNPNFQNYLSFLVTTEDAQLNNLETNQQPTLISNIPPATITKNESLDTIFPFKLEELSTTLLFSGAVLEEKPIMTMYTDAKVDDHSIKLILDSGSASSIITKQLMDQLVNSIMVPIKVLVMEATQYQALMRNDWLSKTNALLDWNMQKLQISQNGQHTHVPAMYGHFKTINSTTPLIEFEKEEKKPTWKAYQVFWADTEHNKLPPVSSWNDNSKKKQRRTNKLGIKRRQKGKRKGEGRKTNNRQQSHL